MPTQGPLAERNKQLTPKTLREKRCLEFSKCIFCRKAKQKCLPTRYQFMLGEKCDRCLEKGLDCSERKRKEPNMSRAATPAPAPTQPEAVDQDTSREDLTLLSIRSILLMALKEMKELGDEIDTALEENDNPKWSIRARCFENATMEYRRFTQVLQKEVKNRALLYDVLETDYDQPSFTWLPSESALQETRAKIENLIKLGHHGYAHVLQMQRLVEHPHLTSIDDEVRRLIQCRILFLTNLRDTRKNEWLNKHAPKMLLGSQLFIPRKLLKISEVMNHVRDYEVKDCLGRTVSHMAFDAGSQDPWLEKHITDQDILGRCAMHLACRYGSVKLDGECYLIQRTFTAKLVSGMTPLHIAASMGYTRICETILRNGGGSLIEERDCAGRTPFACATSCGHGATLAFLLKESLDSSC